MAAKSLCEPAVCERAAWISSIPETSAVHFTGQQDPHLTGQQDPFVTLQQDTLSLDHADPLESVFIIDPSIETMECDSFTPRLQRPQPTQNFSCANSFNASDIVPDDSSVLRLQPMQPMTRLSRAGSFQESRLRPTQPTPNLSRAGSFYTAGRTQQRGTAMDPAFSETLFSKLDKAFEKHDLPSAKQQRNLKVADPQPESFKCFEETLDMFASIFCCAEAVERDQFPVIADISVANDEQTSFGAAASDQVLAIPESA